MASMHCANPMPRLPARKSCPIPTPVSSKRATAAESTNSAIDYSSELCGGPAARLRECVRCAELVASEAAIFAIASGTSCLPVIGGAGNAVGDAAPRL